MSEMPAVYSKTRRRARKPHRCYECEGTIAKGEPYNSHEGLWDGRWRTYKVCPDCDSLRDDLDARVTDFEDRICFGDLAGTALDSPNPATFYRFLAIQRKRGARIQDWVLKREAELIEMELMPCGCSPFNWCEEHRPEDLPEEKDLGYEYSNCW